MATPKRYWGNGNYYQYLDRSIPGGNVGNWSQAKDWAHRNSWLQQKIYNNNHFTGRKLFCCLPLKQRQRNLNQSLKQDNKSFTSRAQSRQIFRINSIVQKIY